MEMDDIIKLNVGGNIHQCYKSTLMLYPDALLARMLSSGKFQKISFLCSTFFLLIY